MDEIPHALACTDDQVLPAPCVPCETSRVPHLTAYASLFYFCSLFFWTFPTFHSTHPVQGLSASFRVFQGLSASFRVLQGPSATADVQMR